MSKTPIKIIIVAVVVLLFAWFIWPSGRDDLEADLAGVKDSHEMSRAEPAALVSTIQPISNAEASVNNGVLSGGLALADINEPLIDEAFVELFDSAVDLLRNDEQQRAIGILSSLIKVNPNVIEPYLNLASLHVQSGDLDRARIVLNQALNANPNTKLVFDGLQKIHGVQAAQAYKQALNVSGRGAQMVLPIVSSLSVTPVGRGLTVADSEPGKVSELHELSQLNQNIVASNKQLKRDNEDLMSERKSFNERLNSLKRITESLELKSNGLDLELKNIELEKQSLETENTSLQGELAKIELGNQERIALENQRNQKLDREQSEYFKNLEDQILKLQKQLSQESRSHANELAEIKQDLSAQTLSAANSRKTIVELRRQYSQKIETSPASTIHEPASSGDDPVLGNELAVRDRALASVIKDWARSWSSQDVDAYVAHYRDGYTPPGSGLTYEQWLAQRKVRLTNKKFINVSVTNFKVTSISSESTSDKVHVTFSQHYRSNTVDDRISKRLTLIKHGADWAEAKIVDERVVSR